MVNAKLHILIASIGIYLNKINTAMFAQEYSAKGGESWLNKETQSHVANLGLVIEL